MWAWSSKSDVQLFTCSVSRFPFLGNLLLFSFHNTSFRSHTWTTFKRFSISLPGYAKIPTVNGPAVGNAFKVNSTTMPNWFPPPANNFSIGTARHQYILPRIAQNRSGSFVALVLTILPSANITVAANMLSIANPRWGVNGLYPPPVR